MKKILPLIITAVVAGAVMFFVGMTYGKSVSSSTALSGAGANRNFRNGAGGVRTGGNKNAGGFVNGDIIAKDEKSITVNLQNAGSKIIFYSTSTKIMKAATGNSADLQIGEMVSVNGDTNPDGSINAQTLQLRAPSSTPGSFIQK